MSLRGVRPGRDMSQTLLAWRAACGYTQERAAEVLVVPVDLLRAWESGQPVPYPALIETAIGLPVVKTIQ